MALWFFLSSLLWLTAVSGNFLKYDYEKKELHIQYPLPEHGVPSQSLLHVSVTREMKGSGNTTTLAIWDVSSDQQGRVQSRHERVRVPKGPIEFLEATLEHVTCHDSMAYEYVGVVFINGNGTPRKECRQQFQFIGDISQPVITQTPLKGRYNEGELLFLNCSAFIGTEDNGVVWESGFEEGSFSPVTGEDENPAKGRALGERQEILPDCTRKSYFPLRYRVKAEDDGKYFQCRLRRTQQTTRIAIVVTTGKEKCAERTELENIRMAGSELQREVTQARTGQVAERGGSLFTSQLLMVIIIMVAMVIIAVLVVFAYRHWQKNQQQPVVIVESQNPSEISYMDRHQPPSLPRDSDMVPRTSSPPRQCNTTIPKWIADTHHPHLESNLSSRSNSSNCPDFVSASVYVSMSAIDRCGEPPLPLLPGGGADAAQDGRSVHAQPAEAETGVLIPDMETDRSQSLYSNHEVIRMENPKVAAASTNAASGCIEILKCADENAGNLKFVDDDEDKSVYVRTFCGIDLEKK